MHLVVHLVGKMVALWDDSQVGLMAVGMAVMMVVDLDEMKVVMMVDMTVW